MKKLHLIPACWRWLAAFGSGNLLAQGNRVAMGDGPPEDRPYRYAKRLRMRAAALIQRRVDLSLSHVDGCDAETTLLTGHGPKATH